MCGIAGVYHFKNKKVVNEQTVTAMRDTLRHRGPDDSGVYISPDTRLGFGSRRLKIIDLSPNGHMPMGNGPQKVWITFNGEIYNFKELRTELGKKGYRFRSSGDTEVVLAAYDAYGIDCVQHFNGMFAFALWDETRERLFCARDHLGIKPFYYAVQNGSFYFGSESKAILAHPDFKKELDEVGVSHYLTFSTTPPQNTLFKNIRKLPPAHSIVIEKGKDIDLKEYWNPLNAPRISGNEHFFVQEIQKILRSSIRQQMVSDVPFGCFLSGGIDSSTNAALMSEALGTPVETFSVGSKQFEKYNEFYYSRRMAKAIGARTHEVTIGNEHVLEFLEQFPFFADDPNGDQACVPLYFLAQLTRAQNVTVVQIGEGADELFAGYGVYLSALQLYKQWWRPLAQSPAFIRRLPYALSSLSNNPRLDFSKEYFRRLACAQEPFWGNAIAFTDYHKERLCTDRMRKYTGGQSSYGVLEETYKEIDRLDPEADFLKRITYLELKHRLPELLLARADRMTMAHSIEGRVPFLDRRLVELALQIPTALKCKNNEPKHILKKAVEGIIPPELIWRKKQGFSTAMSEWLQPQSAIANTLIHTIRASKLRERGLLNYAYVDRIIDAHQKHGVEHNFRIWNLVTLSRWYNYWF